MTSELPSLPHNIRPLNSISDSLDRFSFFRSSNYGLVATVALMTLGLLALCFLPVCYTYLRKKFKASLAQDGEKRPGPTPIQTMPKTEEPPKYEVISREETAKRYDLISAAPIISKTITKTGEDKIHEEQIPIEKTSLCKLAKKQLELALRQPPHKKSVKNESIIFVGVKEVVFKDGALGLPNTKDKSKQYEKPEGGLNGKSWRFQIGDDFYHVHSVGYRVLAIL